MTNPTDPRVEAACLEFWGADDWGRYSFLQQRARKRKVASALKAADEAAWRPIESAPKDGTQILAYDSGGRVLVEYLNGNWWSDHGCTFDPTHWQPLPTPPKTP